MQEMILDLIKKMIKYSGAFIVALLIFTFFPAFLICRKYQQYKIIENRKQRLCNGINLLEPIEIGGIKQWISVRDESKDNPLLLVIHGGPGFSMMPYSFIFNPLESKFTVVQWD